MCIRDSAKACIGDAYVGLEDYKKALGYFEQAAAEIDNIYAAGYLLKAGVVAEKLGENYKTLLAAIEKAKPAAAKGQYIRSCVVATTMGPGVRINPAKAVITD